MSRHGLNALAYVSRFFITYRTVLGAHRSLSLAKTFPAVSDPKFLRRSTYYGIAQDVVSSKTMEYRPRAQLTHSKI